MILFALIFSLSDFLIQPAYWFDEAVTMEIARNFNLFGELDILTAPGVFSGVPYIAGTNGYPLTIPLALFFRGAGYGLFQARVFMLFWIAACLIAIYAVSKKIYGTVPALGALLLVSTFASFYGNGLTATGEAPGFLFFLLALFLAAYKKDYALAGICAGFAMAAKPGVYLFLAHAIFLFILFAEQGTRVKAFVRFTLGLIPPIMLWILLAFPLTTDTFFSTVIYVFNPFDIPVLRNLFHAVPLSNLNENLVASSSGGVFANVRENAVLLLTTSTGIYFLLIFTLVLLAFFLLKNVHAERRRFSSLALWYAVFALAYFLRGPGWIRYLFGFQVLFLMLFTPSLQVLVLRVKEKFFPQFSYAIGFLFCGIAILTAVQTYHLFYLSNVPRSRAPLELASYAEARLREDARLTLGLVNVPEAAAFSDPARMYHTVWLKRTMPPFGDSVFKNKNRPGLIITDGKNFLLGKEGEMILQNEYAEIEKFGKYRVYELD